MTSPVAALTALKQSLWYDNIERRLLENGALAAMIANGEIRGITSNPSIFHHAIADDEGYRAYAQALKSMSWAGYNRQDIFDRLSIEDIRAAADLFGDLYETTHGGDGYVSLEVSPTLAHDSRGTLSEAVRLWQAVDRPNLMV
jgi:transaldolase